MPQGEFYKWLFSKIEDQMNDKKKLAYSVAAVLDISVSSAYKRISGINKLTADELVKLMTEYDIELQEYEGFSRQKLRLTAERPVYIEDTESLQQYLQDTGVMLERMVVIKHELFYAARDLPLFLYFFSDNLTRFKHLIWLRSANYEQHREMTLCDIPERLVKTSSGFFNLYQRINTQELWTERTLLNQLHQLESLVDGLVIKPSDAHLILEDLRALLDEVFLNESQNTGNHIIHHLPYLNMANNALLNTEAHRLVFLSFAGINYVKSSNASLCNDMQHWFEEQIQLGVNLNNSLQHRERLLRKYRQQIEDAGTRIGS